MIVCWVVCNNKCVVRKMMRPYLLAKITVKSIGVFFIHIEKRVSLGNTKIIPRSLARTLRFMRPLARVSGSLATSTLSFKPLIIIGYVSRGSAIKFPLCVAKTNVHKNPAIQFIPRNLFILCQLIAFLCTLMHVSNRTQYDHSKHNVGMNFN